ncbi:hypothetical protein [Cohnella yongneupensis]|uniref:Uncharacterized protein n=1 Tax=Cohnella yongneupensis TaxID=425006 RepID=A0ABW0R421_9BACL
MGDAQANGQPNAPLPLSFARMQIVPEAELTRRVETVKVLKEQDGELYRLAKDSETGEHYLHYAVYHLNIAGGGAEEHYHHLMPLAHDEVIAMALGAPWPSYPSEWQNAYLRNGPHGGFVWYDPGGGALDEAVYEDAAAMLREQLLEFRRSGEGGEEAIRRLFDTIDRKLPPEPER